MFGRRNAASGHPGRSGGALLRWSGTAISVPPKNLHQVMAWGINMVPPAFFAGVWLGDVPILGQKQKSTLYALKSATPASSGPSPHGSTHMEVPDQRSKAPPLRRGCPDAALRRPNIRGSARRSFDSFGAFRYGSEPNCAERSHGCSGAAMRRPGIRGVAEALCYAGPGPP